MATKHTIHRRTTSVTGPHAGDDRDGRFDHYYWRCERCGLESTAARLREGCPRCRPRAASSTDGGDAGRPGTARAPDAERRRDPAGVDADA